MPRAKHNWDQIFTDLRSGTPEPEVRKRYAIPLGTWQSALSRERRKPDGGRLADPGKVHPIRPRASEPKKSRAEKLVELETRRAQEKEAAAAAERERMRRAIDDVIGRDRVRAMIRRLFDMLDTHRTPNGAWLKPRDYVDLTKALHLHLAELSTLLAAEDAMADPETQRPIEWDTEEGKAELLGHLEGLPVSLLGRLEPRKLRAALQLAERRAG